MSSSSEAQASQSTPSKTPSAKEQSFIDSILKLYCLSPDHEAYSRYAEDAVFHDPVSIARGKESIMSQFNGMPKIFARSETKKIQMLTTSTPSKLIFDLDQHYVFKSPIPFKSEGTEKTVNSKLTFTLDESTGLIKEHLEEWDHESNKTGETDGFLGRVQEGRKKMGAKIVEKVVSSDPDKV